MIYTKFLCIYAIFKDARMYVTRASVKDISSEVVVGIVNGWDKFVFKE